MTPDRGFDVAEFQARVARAQARMADLGLDALLVTTEPEVYYFSGFLTRFWQSPTRPWFVVVPASGAPVAVIPQIGAALMSETWIADIRTWASPDLQDDGVSLLSATLAEVTHPDGRIAMPMGHETHIRMPFSDVLRLQGLLAPREIVPDAGLVRALRVVKSGAEVAKIRTACEIAGRAFDHLPGVATEGMALDEVFRRFQMLCLEEGADWVGYLAGGAGAGGYADVIRPASDRPIAGGDVLMLDTGVVWDGYYCDFDRNFAVGAVSPETEAAHARLIEATTAGFEAARPGARASDVFAAMDGVLTGGEAPDGGGRLGHGLGMQLTEWPSLMPGDDTILEAGMVLTLEPWVDTGAGRMLVHEENILVTVAGAEWLTRPSGPRLGRIG